MKRKVTSLLLALALVLSLGSISAFATDATLTDGSYTATAAYMNASNPTNKSMSAPIFAETADITVSGDNATVSIYVANPVPYGDGVTSENGSITNAKITIDGTEYTGTVGVQNTSKTFHASTGLFTITEGASLTCDTVTFTMPAATFDADGTTSLVMSVHVNPVMNADVSVQINISDITAAAAAKTPTGTKTADVTVNVTVENAPTYVITIPSSTITEDTALSNTENNNINYSIAVDASHLAEGGYVDVTAPESGNLKSGTNTLAYTNTLTGNTGITEDTTVNGTITITKDAVDAAANGTYTGTIIFTISYYEA